MKKLSTLLVMLFATLLGTSQVVINEFQVDNNTVELKNIGTETIDVSGWFLCSFPEYSALGSLTLEGGDLNMEPGEIIYVIGHPMTADDELGLYNMPSYGSSAAIEDYVEWGSSPHQRASVAQGAGIWTVGNFLATPENGVAYAYDGDGDMVADWIAQASTFGEENFGGCEVIGGTISTDDPTEICAGDGVADPINVTLEGNVGESSAWVITDEAGNILDLPVGGPFDLEGAGAGVCLIWHLSFEGEISGAEVGMNAEDLEGCFELSNAISVTRNGVAGGEISTTDETTVCIGDGGADLITATLEGAEGENTQWVITDDAGMILEFPAEGPFNFEEAPAGVCLIWNLSFNGELTGAEVGMNAEDITGCYSLSNAITVTRLAGEDCPCEAMGGEITTEDPTEICAGDGVADPINVTLEGNEGENSAWVITDEAGMILGLPEGGPFDLEGAGGGVSLIWHLSFNGELAGAEVGMNANDLEGCFSLSNAITVTRNGVAGGEISTEDLTEICAGDGVADPIDVALEGNDGENSAWVITDEDLNILGLPEGSPFDLEGAGEGVCLIWHLSFNGELTGAEVGMNAGNLEGCFSLSNSIAVTRTGVAGGTISTDDPLIICADDDIDNPIEVTLEGNEGTNSAWVITDEDLNILGLPEGNVINLEGAEAEVCLIWHLSFEDGIIGAEVGMNAANLEGCYSLSNSIAVTRLTGDDCDCVVDGGAISTEDNTDICAGDGVADPINVTLTNEVGTNSAWVITDVDGEILGLPEGSPFDLDGAGEGVCLIWHLSFEDGIIGAEVGMNANDLEGCFSLSNPIEVVRTQVTGGTISTEDVTEICVSDGVADPINVTLEGNEGTNSAWVITDEDLNILGLPEGSPFDLEGAGPGLCLIWHLSFEDGLVGAEVGMNAGNLEGCYSLSNSIAVTRTEINGGTVSTDDGETTVTITVGDGLEDIITFESADNIGTNYAFVVTDDADNILAVLEGDSNDFEEAGGGICHLWGIAYEGDLLLPLEGTINDIAADGCFQLSENFVTIDRQPVGVYEYISGSFNVWPNPTNGVLTLELPLGASKANLQVYSTTGALVADIPVTGSNSSTISLETLPAGAYVLVLSTEDGNALRQTLLKK